MDVRCESCQTVYEFDDARVKEGGVTVKCTQCGHIFKVRKRTPGQRGPSTLPGFAPIRDGSGPHGDPAGPAGPAGPSGSAGPSGPAGPSGLSGPSWSSRPSGPLSVGPTAGSGGDGAAAGSSP